MPKSHERSHGWPRSRRAQAWNVGGVPTVLQRSASWGHSLPGEGSAGRTVVAPTVCEERTDDELSASDLGLRGAHEGSASGLSTDDDLDDVPVEPARAQAAMARVVLWRESHLMVADVDFAHAYDCFQDVYAAAGRAVAFEWSRVRCIVH